MPAGVEGTTDDRLAAWRSDASAPLSNRTKARLQFTVPANSSSPCDPQALNDQIFRQLFSQSSVAMLVAQMDGRPIEVNQAFCDLLGYRLDEAASLDLSEVVHPDYIDQISANPVQSLEGAAQSFDAELIFLHRDGTQIWVRLTVNRIAGGPGGTTPLLFIQLRDIDQRKRAEVALAAAEELFRNTMENSVTGFLLIEPTGSIMLSNRAAWEALGHSEAELKALSLSEFVHPDDLPEAVRGLRAVIRGDIPAYWAERRLQRKAGSTLHALVAISAARRPDRTLSHIIVQFADITARRQAEQDLADTKNILQAALDTAGMGLLVSYAPHGYIEINDRARELWGLPSGTIRVHQSDLEERIHANDRLKVSATIRQSLEAGRDLDVEYRIMPSPHAIRHIRSRGKLIDGGAGSSSYRVVTHLNTTRYHNLAEELSTERERFKVVLESIADAVIATSDKGLVTYVNPAAERLIAGTVGNPVGLRLSDVMHPVIHAEDGRQGSLLELDLFDANGQPSKREHYLSLRDRDNRMRLISLNAAPLRNGLEPSPGTVYVMRDITEQQKLQTDLHFAANHDALTGLPNRRAFEARLDRILAEINVGGERHALCLLDLDRFKVVNDTAGHAAGDALLAHVGKVITAFLCKSDVVARLGGDEFGLILHQVSAPDALPKLERLIGVINSIRFPWGGRVYDVGASIGLTEIASSAGDTSELMSRADVACYMAKSAGRNRIEIYGQGNGGAERLRGELRIAADIRSALDENRFRLFAQEIRRIDGRESHRRVEILLRLIDRDGIVQSPGIFIPVAEQYNLMGEVDRWVIHNALIVHGATIAAEPDLSVSINLSASTLGNPLLLAWLQTVLGSTPVPLSRITFEVTETALISSLTIAATTLGALRLAGCRIAIDDFGAGLSSFSYMRVFRFDYLKIDGSFVRQLATNPHDRIIIESMHDLARKFGAETIAEFVESRAILDVLKDIGVNFAQGYEIAFPIPLEAFLSQISTQKLPRRIGN